MVGRINRMLLQRDGELHEERAQFMRQHHSCRFRGGPSHSAFIGTSGRNLRPRTARLCMPPRHLFGVDFAGMRTALATVVVLVYLGVVYDRTTAQAPGPSTRQNPAGTAAPAVSPQRALLDQYCMGCHSDQVRSGGLALSVLDLTAVADHAELA